MACIVIETPSLSPDTFTSARTLSRTHYIRSIARCLTACRRGRGARLSRVCCRPGLDPGERDPGRGARRPAWLFFPAALILIYKNKTPTLPPSFLCSFYRILLFLRGKSFYPPQSLALSLAQTIDFAFSLLDPQQAGAFEKPRLERVLHVRALGLFHLQHISMLCDYYYLILCYVVYKLENWTSASSIIALSERFIPCHHCY